MSWDGITYEMVAACSAKDRMTLRHIDVFEYCMALRETAWSAGNFSVAAGRKRGVRALYKVQDFTVEESSWVTAHDPLFVLLSTVILR